MPVAPIIKTESLEPRSSLAGYGFTWQENALIAYADLLPIRDQPMRGFTLQCGYNTASGKEPTDRQVDKGTTLTSLVRALLIEHMQRGGWSVISRDSSGKDIWQHASRIPRPLNQAGQTSPEQKPDGLVKVVYRKTRAVTFTCAWCQQTVTEQRYPSHTPLYCSKPACKQEATKAKTRARVADWRTAHPDVRRKKKAV